ncbi:MAG: LysR family transcriptional regulator [Planctomycetota bacterium]
MDLDQLRQFLRVAELGNITRAAEAMGVSQPALSRSMQRLEEEFGQPLLERKPRRVDLTDAGVLLQARAQQVLNLVDDAKAEICDDGRSGRLRIGAIPTIAPYFLPGFLRAFSDAFPAARLLVQEETTDRLLARCKQGEVDLALLALPVQAKYVEVEELFTEELLLMLPPDHPLAAKPRVTLAQVEPYPFILLDEAHCLSDNIVSLCRRKSFHPVVVERTNQLATVQELVSLGHGVSMAPAMARAMDASPARVYRQVTTPKPTRTIAAVWNPYRFQSKLLKALRERLRVYAKELEKG